jgi:prolyl oligopeptidase PreP (S9A serine peptidase family)
MQERMKALPSFFEAGGLLTEQFEAVSLDGTKVSHGIVLCSALL